MNSLPRHKLKNGSSAPEFDSTERASSLLMILCALALGSIILLLSFPALKQLVATTRNALVRSELRERTLMAKEHIRQGILDAQGLPQLPTTALLATSGISSLIGRSPRPQPSSVGIQLHLVVSSYPLRALATLSRSRATYEGIFCANHTGALDYKGFLGVSAFRTKLFRGNASRDRSQEKTGEACYRIRLTSEDPSDLQGDLLLIFPVEDSIIFYLDKDEILRRYSLRDRTSQPIAYGITRFEMLRVVPFETHALVVFRITAESPDNSKTFSTEFFSPLQVRTAGTLEDVVL